ncbi:alkaline phosphatase, placental type [Trichonephila clavipes]|nr:alkaline phosphatase, placental type [Trichonephila clavipes]
MPQQLIDTIILSMGRRCETCLATYNTDSQVGDSGACATALLCGVKGRFETVGLDDKGVYNRCESSFESKVFCLADWAQTDGKSTGLVTTTRVTHATPAAMYAHSANRYWESDDKLTKDVPNDFRSKGECKDIARQLIEDSPGKNFNDMTQPFNKMFQRENPTKSPSPDRAGLSALTKC